MELQNILKLYLGDRVVSFRNTQNVLNFVII